MPEFIITTNECVTGTYHVAAGTAEAARAKFARLPFDWVNVEQIDYEVYTVDVKLIEEVAR